MLRCNKENLLRLQQEHTVSLAAAGDSNDDLRELAGGDGVEAGLLLRAIAERVVEQLGVGRRLHGGVAATGGSFERRGEGCFIRGLR